MLERMFGGPENNPLRGIKSPRMQTPSRLTDISGKMLNTGTKYTCQIVAQIADFTDHPDERSIDSWFWARASAFSSNCLSAGPIWIMIGNVAKGIASPTFGTDMTAHLETWQEAAPRDWQLTGLGGVPRPRYLDLDADTIDGLPALGGCAFDLERLRWAIPGARLGPPDLDPRVFHRERRENSGQACDSRGRNVTIDHRETDGFRYRSETKNLFSALHRGGPRDESVLAKARRTSSKRNAAQSSNEPRRGRPPGRAHTLTEVGKQALSAAEARGGKEKGNHRAQFKTNRRGGGS